MKSLFLIIGTSIAILFSPTIYLHAAAITDSDEDGLTDEQELTVYFTNPNVADTDGDGFNDGMEVDNKYSPLKGENKKLSQTDSDGDGVWDDWELALGTSIMNPDSDGDGYTDGEELKNGYDPNNIKPIRIGKRIEVKLNSQTLRYYFGPIRLDELKISSGLPNTPTPIGEFNIYKKRPIVHYTGAGYNYPNTKWNLAFKKGAWGNYYVHGAYWHNNFGQPMSHGCVNVPYTYEEMGRLYDWADTGTPVIIAN